MKKSLYAKDAKGQIREWTIESLEDGLHFHHGVMNGAMQYEHEPIDIGLAARTLEEQIQSRFDSRVSKKIDSGYTENLEDARTKERTNALGFSKPMLAAKFKDVKNIDYQLLYIQYKYDGNRMLVRNEGGINVAYTRAGKIIDTIPEILEGIVIPEGTTLDGEIYCHGHSLQTLVSWIKRRQENTLKLRYHVYDVMSPFHYNVRLEMLRGYELGEKAELVPTMFYDGSVSINYLLQQARAEGYEGSILRQNDFGYEAGKRSKGLIKVKHFDDGEFEVTGIHLSKRGRVVLDCIMPDGVAFKATAPGTVQQKETIYANKEQYIGKYVHVEYANITKDGAPFHGVATEMLEHEMQNK